MANILIITDSRGYGLQTEIETKLAKSDLDPPPKIEVAVLRGANLDNGYERLSQEINMDNKYDLIYVMLGVNNLSVKMYNKKIVPVFVDVPTLVELMLAKFEIFKCQVSNMGNKIIVCQLIGLSISDYNKNSDIPHKYQIVIMPILAHSLNLVNMDSNVIGPWLTKIIHYWTNHKLYNAYSKLRDGVHFTTHTTKVVAKRIAESILKNM